MTGKAPTLATLAAEQFARAVASGDIADIEAAAENLLKVEGNASQVRVTRAVGRISNHVVALVKRVEELERKVELHQRHLKMLDLIEDSRARAYEQS